MNILLAIDSSATAQAALAATLARNWPDATNFRVVTVFPFKSRALLDQPNMGPERDRAHCLIDRATREIECRNEDSIVVGQIVLGDPTKRILALANSWPADLIIVGSHDRGPLQRLFMGSVSSSVLQQASCSVLVARNLPTWHTAVTPLNRVLVAIDDSVSSQAVVGAVLGSKWPEHTQFCLLTVAKSVGSAYSYEPSAIRLISALEQQAEHLQKLQAVVQSISLKFEDVFGPGCVEYAVLEGQPEEVILRTARDWQAQLIAVGSTGRPDLTRRLLGSVSQAVAIEASCSVQIIRSNVAQLNRRQPVLESADQMLTASGF